MLNLKSFEDFLNEDGEFTSPVPAYRLLNESTDKFSEDFFNKIARLSGQRCLVFNDIEFAEKLSENNDVWCVCFNYKGKFPKSNVKYAAITLKNKGQKVHPETIKKLLYRENNNGEITEYGIFLTDPIFKDKTFDFIFNISLESYGHLRYNVITNLNIFILSNLFTPGITAYYSFDEKDVAMQFAIEVKELGYRSKEKKKIPFNEWKSSVDGYGFNSNYVDTGDSDIDLEKHDRYLSVIYVDNDEYLNNRENLDETDTIGDEESMDESGIIRGMVEPEIYAFKANMMDEALGIDALKVGDTNRGVDVRIGEWGKKYAPEDTQYKIDLLGHWSSVISGCGEGLDGKIFRDKSIHKILMNDEKFQKKGIRNVGTPEERDVLKEKGIYFSNEFFENCTTKDVEDAIDILYDSIRKNRINVISELKEASKNKYDFIFPLHNNPVPFKPRKLQQDVIDAFKDRFKRNYKEMLIYAVMRFGKTFVACECVKDFCESSEKKNGKFILVVSAKVDVKDEWLGAVNPYSDYSNIDMYTSRKGVGGLLNMLNEKREWIYKEYVKDESEEDGFKKDENGNKVIDIEKSIPGPHPGKSFNNLEEYFREYPDKNIMLFASFQDLNGNNQNFDKLDEIENPEDIDYVKQQHKCFFDYPIDMVIIDEAHYGAQADSFGYLIGEGGIALKKKKSKQKTSKTNPETGETTITKKDYDLIMSKLKIENALKLHLSGTPYNLVYDEHFKNDEIIAKFSFADLMSAKDEWINRYKKFIDDQIPVHIDVEDGEEPDPNEGKILTYENNPYYGIPEMLNFGYKFDEFQLKQLKGIGSYDFNTLFKLDKSKKKFVYESDILQMFQAIDGSKKKSGVLDLLNEPRIKKGNMCKHIVMVLPSKDSCDVMANFLEKKKKKLTNLGRYTVINIAGNTTDYDTKTAKKMIYTENAHGNKTISLTVDRMLTGVTVKPWDTMFYMKDGLSPQSYDQAKFRIQTPYVKNVPELELTDDMKTIGVVKDEDGNIVAHKVDMKPQTVFVDFSADRIFVLLHNRYVAELAAQGITEDSPNYEDEYVKLAERDLKYLPIITHETGKLKSLTSENIMSVIRKSLARTYFDKELDDLIKSIKWPEPDDKDVDNIDDFPTRYSEKKTGKDPLITSANKGEEEKVDPSLLAKGDEETKETTLKHKPIKKMTPEEKSALFMKFRNQCQTIMMNFAVYFIARKDNQKIFKWKHIFADSMRNVDTDAEGNRTDGINVGIIINIFGDGIIPENFNERQEKVKEIKRELGYWKDYYLTKKPGLQEEVLNKLIAMAERYDGEKRDFNNIKSSLKSFSKLGKTEFITPDDLSEKLLENVVIFNKDTKILDCYGSKIGEILNYLSTNEKFADDFNIDNYYLIVKNSMIAELCKVVFNIAYERQNEWNSKQRRSKDKKYLTFKDKDGKESKKLTFSNRFEKENWFDSHILIYNTDKLEKEEEETEKKPVDTPTETPVETSSENQVTQGINDGYVFVNVKPLVEKRVKSTATVLKDKSKVSVVELENAIKNKWGEQMDWQIITGNPPYGKNLHLKIINTVINHLTEDGVASFIHPARWFQDPLAEIKKNSDKVKFKDIVSKIEKVKMMDPLSVYKHFKIISNGDLMISYMKKNNTHKVELYDDTFKNGFDTILKYSLKHNLNNVIDENCIDGWRVLIKRVLAAKTENGRMDKYARIDCLKVVPNISVFYNGKTKDGLDWTETFNSGDKKKEKGTPMQKSIQFKSEEEANNFSTSCHTNFFMNCMYLFRFGIDAPLAYLPWMKDYSHPWTDEDFCKFFGKLGMSKECQEWMCREVSDYRIKDFINYMKFDDSKIEEEPEEYSETDIEPEEESPSSSETSKPVVDDEDEETQDELTWKNILDGNDEEDEA